MTSEQQTGDKKWLSEGIEPLFYSWNAANVATDTFLSPLEVGYMTCIRIDRAFTLYHDPLPDYYLLHCVYSG